MYGPTDACAPIAAPRQWDRTTVAPSATVQADSVVSGPMVQPAPTTVPLRSGNGQTEFCYAGAGASALV